MAHDHDSHYKLLFSHPQMVRDLLTGFVHGEWLNDVDFSTLERVNGSYVSQTAAPVQRHDDVVWKVRLRERWLYVYLLLEFQSVADHFMALRMMVYVGLLYQDLVRRGELTEDGKLPPVLPIVLYNGRPRWNAPLCIEDLVVQPPVGLELYLPRCAYLLLDEGRYRADQLNPLRNVAAALFRLETQRSVEDVQQVVIALVDWLKDEEQRSLRLAFVRWIKRLLRSQLPEETIDGINDLQEVASMFGENIKTWFEEYTEKGLQEGLSRGLNEGLEMGLQKGLQEGRQEGRQEGWQHGEALALQRILTKRFGAIPSDMTSRIAGATVGQIDVWIDAALEADTLAAVFVEHKPPTSVCVERTS